ncbi:hypothetical protein [Persicobacter psychrovividus]|uniref:DUF4488 domain-containing protein n=1 Tax=Persicobacter psychrovividus TaxID=387638 RepID=A0ABM7VER2_9BACT|nr:hypothetical protein PEPS_16110 [Persicobacter psychrovividus]
MKKLNLLLLIGFFGVIGLLAITAATHKKDHHPLAGSWELSEFRYGKDEALNELPEQLKYVKHITEEHFTWVSYSPTDGGVVGAGGGTYELNKDYYTEHIKFFQPAGSNLVGTSVKFKYELKKNQWKIWGYIHEIQIDPSSGKFTKVDSTYLEEVWHRLP